MTKRRLCVGVILFFAGILTLSGCQGKVDESSSAEETGIEEASTLSTSEEELQTPLESSPTQGALSASSTETVSPPSSLSEAETGSEPTSEMIQKALKNAGYYSAEVDGKVGKKTKAAIEEFQKANGLVVDGVVGKQTWSKLKQYLY